MVLDGNGLGVKGENRTWTHSAAMTSEQSADKAVRKHCLKSKVKEVTGGGGGVKGARDQTSLLL